PAMPVQQRGMVARGTFFPLQPGLAEYRFILRIAWLAVPLKGFKLLSTAFQQPAYRFLLPVIRKEIKWRVLSILFSHEKHRHVWREQHCRRRNLERGHTRQGRQTPPVRPVARQIVILVEDDEMPSVDACRRGAVFPVTEPDIFPAVHEPFGPRLCQLLDRS